jgi:hypothetical protein
MADVGVFSRYKGFADFQEEARKTGLAEALTMAQIQKATAPDEFNIEKVGQQAFIKAAQGIPLDPTEAASLQYLDNKSQTATFNPVTGALEQKPSLLQRAGISIAQPAAAPPAPAPKMGAPFRNGMAPTTKEAAGGGDFLNDVAPKMDTTGLETNVDDYVKQNPLPLTPAQSRQSKQQQELAAAGGNEKLKQSIREKYVAAESPTVKFEQENKLRDEFTAMTKPFRELQDAYSKVQNISDTAAGDIALLYATAKLNDPTSVVRESEFAVQASAGSLGDRWKNAVGKIQSGQRLTESQRQQLKDETENLYRAQLQGYDQLKQQFNGIAYENQLNPKNIIADYATPKKMPATPAEARDQFNASKKPKVRLKYNPATGDFE